jgi:hypothetical protein
MRRTRWATAQRSWFGVGLGWLLALSPVLALGCGDVDAGSTPFAGTVLFVDPAGAYRFNLVEPPWIPDTFDGVTVFVVPPSDLSAVTDLSAALYTLHVDTALGAPESNRDNEASAVFATATGTSSLQIAEGTVRTVAGDQAYELAWIPSSGLYERDVFLAAPTSATFRLQFGAKVPIADDPMITQMILSFEPL